MIDAKMAEEIIQTLQLLLGAKQPHDETKPPRKFHRQDSHVPTALTCAHAFSTGKFVCFFVRTSLGRKLVSAEKLRQAVAEAHGGYGASEAACSHRAVRNGGHIMGTSWAHHGHNSNISNTRKRCPVPLFCK